MCLKKSRGSDLGFILAKGSDYHSFHVQKIYGPPATKSVLRTGDKIYKVRQAVVSRYSLRKCPCNIQRIFESLKIGIFS